MKLYYATVDDYENQTIMTCENKHILCSYFYFEDKFKTLDLRKLSEKMKDDPDFSLFIDSGAFSAHNSGGRIYLTEYCKWIQRLKPEVYAGLDVIGDSEKTWINQKRMEDEFGLSPIPTYHMGEALDDIIPLVEEYDYIALGGMVFSAGKLKWLDEIWRTMLQIKPDIKVHGFGLTTQEAMLRYPWYSVDSSSFKAGKRYGRVTLLNKDTMEFYVVKDKDYVENYVQNNDIKKSALKGKKLYSLLDKASADAYAEYVAYVTERHKTMDFSFLTGQGRLF